MEKLAQSPTNRDYIILTDSLSSLQALKNSESKNPLIQRILLMNHTLNNGANKTTFMWIPSHAGIQGNELVDQEAKKALNNSAISCKKLVTTQDAKMNNKRIVQQQWRTEWLQQKNRFLLQSKPDALRKDPSWLPRRDEVIINRIKIGHTKLTHSYHFSDLYPPPCPLCGSPDFTVHHLLCKCTSTPEDIRTSEMDTLLNDRQSILKILEFLNNTELYGDI